MNRRGFFKTAAAFSLTSLSHGHESLAHAMGLKQIGVQLFSLPTLLKKDFRAAIQLLNRIGYKETRALWPLPIQYRWVQSQLERCHTGIGF